MMIEYEGSCAYCGVAVCNGFGYASSSLLAETVFRNRVHCSQDCKVEDMRYIISQRLKEKAEAHK